MKPLPRGSLVAQLWASLVTGKTAKSSRVALADQMVVSATNFFTGIFLARVCDLRKYGIYVICFSILLLLNSIPAAVVTGPMQVLTPVIRDEAENRGYLRGLMLFQILLTACLACTVWFAIPIVGTFVGPGAGFLRAFGAMGMAIVFLQGQEFFRRVLFSKFMFERALANDILHGLLRVVFLLLVWRFGIAPLEFAPARFLNAETAFLSIAAASALSCILGFVQCKGFLRGGTGTLRSAASRNWKLGRWNLSDSAVSYSGNQLVVLLVGGMVGMSGAASFEASRLMSGPVQVVQFALANVLGVRVSDLFCNSSPQHAFRLVRLTTWGGLISFLLYLLVFWLFSGFIIDVTVGMKYSEDLSSMLLFGLFYLVNWVSVMQSILANAAMKPEIGFWGTLAGALTSLSLSLALIPRGGVCGAVLAVTVGQTVSVLVKWNQVRSRIHGAEAQGGQIPRAVSAIRLEGEGEESTHRDREAPR